MSLLLEILLLFVQVRHLRQCSNAQLDAAVSRSFDNAFEIFQNEISSGTLSKTTVLAISVNSLNHYQKIFNSLLMLCLMATVWLLLRHIMLVMKRKLKRRVIMN